MYTYPHGFESQVPGEPRPDAIFREQYHNMKAADAVSEDAPLIDPSVRQRAALLRAQVTVGVGRFFS